MEEKNGSTAKTMGLLFLGGAIVGAAAGLLFAPQAGRETRKTLKEYANKVGEKTKGGIDAALEKGRAVLGSKAA